MDRPSGKARRVAIQRLEALQRAGVSHVSKATACALVESITRPAETSETKTLAATAAAPARSVVAEPASSPKPHIPTAQVSLPGLQHNNTPLPLEQRPAALELIQQDVIACVRCPQLAGSRTQTVFGVGNPGARLCFLGEAPGADEDAQGEPFVGRAGQLLNKIIEACKLKREEVYILNVLKCRPPGNRNPLPDEMANCRGFLNAQLNIIRPEFICCLGSIAAKALLNTETSIGRLRGRFHEYNGATVICTYHPAYLLRNPAAKKDVWDDMKMLMARMGVEL